jgi:TonB family protein
MTPAEEQDPRIPQAAKLQDGRFLPRLDARAFWSAEHHLGRSQITSTIIHGSFAALLVMLPYFYQQVMPSPKMNPPPIFITPSREIGIYLTPQVGALPQIPHGGGSGGGGDKDQVTKGMLRFGPTQILPPHLQSNLNAALQVPANLVGDPSLNASMVQMPNWGDPEALAFNNSNGRDDGDGMGDKRGPGVGDKGVPGPGYGSGTDGNMGGDAYLQGGYVVSDPVCAFCPRPEYSDEARKAKYQGQVLLSVVVLPNGQAGKIQVVNNPGLGLDQKAIEAVRNWRFKPAIGRDGKPVATVVTIQVMFQLF